jgi:2-keto-4-pentenoate hydratase/2-oxohepta-3-ene-1,7-dioic acid hydratase in catechol pathway
MENRKPNVPRIFCIGRNYVAHAAELGNPVPEEPVVFMKPPHCLVPPGAAIRFPPHGKELHHEAEVVLRIGRRCVNVNIEQAADLIDGVGLGLDLTLRDVQASLKKRGLPWEKAKAFEQSAPLGTIVEIGRIADINDLAFICKVNGQVRQQGCTADMIFPPARIVSCLSGIWELLPGDLIYTGTPEGVAQLFPDDTITVEADWAGSHSWKIVSN